MKKVVLLTSGVFFLGIIGVFAANTLIHDISGNQSSSPGAYPTQQVRTINTGDLKFMNLDNDTLRAGDFFSGYYYDTMYGVFKTDVDTASRVRVASAAPGLCPSSTHSGYKLTGFSYNAEFGFVDFDYDATRFVYMCIANTTGQLGNTVSSYLSGSTYSPEIGFQNFAGIQLESSVIIGTGSLTQDARQIKILGLTSAQTVAETSNGQFLQDFRLVGKSSKIELRKKIQENIVLSKKGISNFVTTGTITDLSGIAWNTNIAGTSILKGEGRYFAPNNGENISISGTNLSGNKTLIVEGGNIYISGNIRGSGILGLFALEKNGQGGNIYIHPSVTDIHALLYADRSLISYSGIELDGSTRDEDLANQLYIKGSLFTENTLGGFQLQKCPFYVGASDCNTSQKAAKYDLNYVRRYVLVQALDVNGAPSGPKVPQFQSATNGLQSYAGGNTRGSRNTEFEKYSVVIEYDSQVQQSPPTLLQ